MTAKVKALDIARARTAQAEKNRAAFPFAAQKLAEVRQWFPEARIVYAKEDGREIGKRIV